MIIIPTVIDLQLPGKILKGVEQMGGIKALIVFSVASFDDIVNNG